MADPLLTLGDFSFSIKTAAYNQLVKTHAWRWAAQPLMGQSDALQYTGKAASTISIDGIIATTLFQAGTKQLDKIIAMGDEGKPYLLTSGLGDVLGYWSITNLTNTETKFLKGGLPRQQSFTIELKFYGDDI